MRISSVGEVLWDVFPQRELLGGAPLTFAVNFGRLGTPSALISAVGTDARGARMLEAAAALGIDARNLLEFPASRAGATPEWSLDECLRLAEIERIHA